MRHYFNPESFGSKKKREELAKQDCGGKKVLTSGSLTIWHLASGIWQHDDSSTGSVCRRMCMLYLTGESAFHSTFGKTSEVQLKWFVLAFSRSHRILP